LKQPEANNVDSAAAKLQFNLDQLKRELEASLKVSGYKEYAKLLTDSSRCNVSLGNSSGKTSIAIAGFGTITTGGRFTNTS
jgi:hypothetical protein